MFGSHLSIAGSMLTAIDEAQRLRFDTVQVFTKNQQQWSAKPLDHGMTRDWNGRVASLGWGDRLVSHASYLINLATHQDELWRKSIDLMTDEIERCEALGIRFLVHHPGSFVGHTLDAGMARIAGAYREIFSRTKGFRTVSCLEDTAGAGSTIGGPFEDLARLRSLIIDATGEPARVAYCLDSCHMHAYGYDLSLRAGADKALTHFDSTCGLANLRVVHLNDSKGAAGSKLDRHAHIGEGTIGTPSLRASGFASIVNHPAIVAIPKILETPKDDRADGVPWDVVNHARLVSLQNGEDSEAKVTEWRDAHSAVDHAALSSTPGRARSSASSGSKRKTKPEEASSTSASPKRAGKPAAAAKSGQSLAKAGKTRTCGASTTNSMGKPASSKRTRSRDGDEAARSSGASGARKMTSSARAKPRRRQA